MGKISQIIDLKTDLNGFVIKNPIMTASGTYGYVNEFEEFVDVKNLGAVVTKAISLNPREGNNHLRIFEVYGGMINSIGLENVGIQRFLAEKAPVLQDENIEFVINLAGSTQVEYIELARICQSNNIKAIELNVSCPNVKSGCLEFGVDENSLSELIKSVRQEFSGCLIVKLTPNVTCIEKLAETAQKSGADVISAINTVKGLGLKLDFNNGKFTKKMIQGGMSGRAIKPIALSMIHRLYKTIDIPIIGMGGIYSFEDMLEFFAVGAQAVQIGTANFTHPTITEKILSELQEFMIKNDYKNLDDLKKELRGVVYEQ